MLPRSSCVCVFRIIGSTTLSTKVWKASGSVLTLKWSKGMCMKNPHAMQISYVDLRAAVQTPIVKPSHTSAPCTERWNYLRSLLWEMFARRKCEWRHLQDKTLHCEIKLPFRRYDLAASSHIVFPWRRAILWMRPQREGSTARKNNAFMFFLLHKSLWVYSYSESKYEFMFQQIKLYNC